jgi:NAD(P)-dependent dehydrogenase (short-subunit alcohol dehydrogenase family)
VQLNLTDKVAIVTGGNRGIGAAVAEELAMEGMNLALVARDIDKLNETAQRLRQATGRIIVAISADLKQSGAAEKVVEQAVAALGRIDLLVNNAGAAKRGAFIDLTDDDWIDGFALKLHGYARMARSAWPYLARGKGNLINIVGVGAWTGIDEFTIGGAINAALMNLTKSLADLGKRDGVRVCAVNPGRIETERLHRNLDRIAGLSGISRAQAARKLLDECGIERFGTPQEIGYAVAFLASDKANYAQGAILDIDGGETSAI